MTALRRLVVILGLLCTAAAALAHKPSDSYLTLKVEGSSLSGQWDIALRDLDFALGLDANGDGRITWGEVRARHTEIAAFAAARLAVSGDGQRCTVQTGAQQVDSHTDGAYTVIPLRVTCPSPAGDAQLPAQLALQYTLFADIDPQHRGLLNLRTADGTRTAVLGPQASVQSFALGAAEAGSTWSQLATYVREGVWHIWIGFDHILFLLSLLLPAVGLWLAQPSRPGQAARTGQPARSTQAAPPAQTAPPAHPLRWKPVDRFSQAGWDVLRIVTAFTVAHSITLSLATLGWVSLPSRLVESAIAASVVLAALNNVWPLFHGRRWWVAFGFGLIHGFGFATVLADLGLPRDALALALVGFNVGVELGQLAIVAVFLPLAFWLRRSAFYRKGVLVGGSLLIAALAAVWFVERAFDLRLMPA